MPHGAIVLECETDLFGEQVAVGFVALPDQVTRDLFPAAGLASRLISPRADCTAVIFFPQWMAQEPKKTVYFQNDQLDLMRRYRDAGPTYPKAVDR